MSLDSIRRACLISGTSYSEAGIRVRIEPMEGEKVLFFVIDEQSNPDCTLRQELGMVGRICDLAVYYARIESSTLCLVELKGSHLEHAISQVINTYEHLKRFLEGAPSQLNLQGMQWKACIRYRKSAPKLQKPHHHLLAKTFGPGGYRFSHHEDLGQFLRR